MNGNSHRWTPPVRQLRTMIMPCGCRVQIGNWPGAADGAFGNNRQTCLGMKQYKAKQDEHKRKLMAEMKRVEESASSAARAFGAGGRISQG